MPQQLTLCGTIIVLAVFCATSSNRALAIDSIDRKSAKSALLGTVSKATRTEIVIKSGPKKKEIRVPVNDVIRIRFDGEPRSLAQGRNFDRTGQLDKAQASFEEALKETKSSQDLLRKEISFLLARISARKTLSSNAGFDVALKLMQDFRTANLTHYRFYEATSWIAQLQLASQQLDESEKEYRELASAPWPDYQMAARIGEARVLIAKDEIVSALSTLESVLSLPAKEEAEKERRHEALLVKTACLQKQNKYDEANTALDKIIQEVTADQTRLMAEAYVRQGDNYRLTGKAKEAVLAYLHVDILFAKERDLHAESLFHLSQLWRSIKHPDRAINAAARLRDEYPQSPWTQRLDTP